MDILIDWLCTIHSEKTSEKRTHSTEHIRSYLKKDRLRRSFCWASSSSSCANPPPSSWRSTAHPSPRNGASGAELCSSIACRRRDTSRPRTELSMCYGCRVTFKASTSIEGHATAVAHSFAHFFFSEFPSSECARKKVALVAPLQSATILLNSAAVPWLSAAGCSSS